MTSWPPIVSLEQIGEMALRPPITPDDDRRRTLHSQDNRGWYIETVESPEQVKAYIEYMRKNGIFTVKLYYGIDLIAAAFLKEARQ